MSDPATPAVDPSAPSAPAKPWHDGLSPEFIGTLENRGVKDKTPVEVAQHFWEAHRNISQTLREKVGTTEPERFLVKPKDWNNEAEVEAFNAKVKPSKWEDYGFEGDGAQEYAEMLLEAGASPATARKLWNAMQEGKAQEATEAETTNGDIKETLRREGVQLDINWGPHRDDNLITAERGAKDLGFTPEEFKEFKNYPGYSKFYEAFLRHGKVIAEEPFTTGPTGTGARSYEQAKALYAEFMRNPHGPDAMAYSNPAHPRYKEVRAEVGRLLQIIDGAESRQRQESGWAA